MAAQSVDFGGFDHELGPFCVCLGCCATSGEAEPLTAEAGARGLQRALEALNAHFPDLAGALADRFLLQDGNDGAGTIPDIAMEQNAGTTYVAYDTDQGDVDQGIDALIYPYKWNTTELTYSFPDSIDDYSYSAPLGFGQLTGELQVMARSALAEFAAAAVFTFTELSGGADRDADLAFALDTGVNSAYAWLPSSSTQGGDSWYGRQLTDPATPAVGSFDYHTFMHEVGHALGLKHGHENTYGGAIPYEMNSMEFSVMTYISYVGHVGGAYTNSDGDFAQSLMMLDIAAIQRMYGANFTENAGDTTYSFDLATGRMYVNGVDVTAAAGLTKFSGSDTVFRTIWDGNGTDTYDFSNYMTSLGVDLSPGAWVDLDTDGHFQRAHLGGGNFARGHIANALQHEGDARSLIENAKGGSGDDWFRGNAADNTFWGAAGSDTFHDSQGSDTYHGGSGLDTLFLESTFSSFSFEASGSFIQAAKDAVDWIADTVEEIHFLDAVWSWTDLFTWIGGGGEPVNAAPLAGDDAATTSEDAGVSVAVLGNDTDPDGDALSISGFSQGANGTVTQSGSALVYMPDPNFNGTDSFSYSVSDGKGGSETASVTVTVSAVNDAPVAVDDTAETEPDRAVTVAVLANDDDPDGDTLSVMSFGQGTHGTVTETAGGLVYTPGAGFSGADSFTYAVTDGRGGTDSATVTVTVNAAAPALTPLRDLLTFEGGIVPDAGGALSLSGLAVVETSELNGAYAGDSSANGGFELNATGEDFDLEAAVFLSDRGMASITVEAWDDGVLKDTVTFQANSKGGTLNSFGTGFDGVDRIVVSSDRAILTDDIDVMTYWEGEPPAPTPAPGAEPVTVDFEGPESANPLSAAGFQFLETTITSRAKGVVSGTQAAQSIAEGMMISRADGDTFDFEGGWFTATSGRKVALTVEAWRDDVMVGSQSETISENRELFVDLNDVLFDEVDQVVISAAGGVLADDLAFLV